MSVYLGFIDYRNAKYQGFIRNNESEGLGIVIDNAFTFSLAKWNRELPEGPLVTVFANGDIFYGAMVNQQLHGICCYTRVNADHLICLYEGGNFLKMVVVDSKNALLEVEQNEGLLKILKSYGRV